MEKQVYHLHAYTYYCGVYIATGLSFYREFFQIQNKRLETTDQNGQL